VTKKEEELTFEAGLTRLEELVHSLEGEDLDLDRSLAVFEEGVRLARLLNRKLDAAEKKLELLLKDEEGRPLSQAFSLTAGEAEEEED
jgi:exodeoxyribonuclease VII small subunit